jgi:thiol-disulfide isomerase/thioredoxin
MVIILKKIPDMEYFYSMARRKSYRPSKIILYVLLLLIVLTTGLMAPAAHAFGVGEEDMERLEQGAAVDESIRVILFWRDGCPHCKAEFKFLEELKDEYPELEVLDYEVSQSPDNARVFRDLMTKLGVKQLGVPATIIGNSVFIGFSEDTADGIEQQIRMIKKGNGSAQSSDTVWVPLIGQVSADDFSLPVFTLIVAGADSINPCALFVLLFLLSFLVHVRSRMRMAVVGGTFVFFSGLIYFLFMAAWLNLFFVLGKINIITAIAGAVAMLIGAINVKDFFAFKKGVSLTLSDEASGKLIKRMRGLLNAESMGSMLTGAVVLAVAANSYELLCTVGLPMIYVRVLTLRELSPFAYYMYLVFYNVVYVIPLLLVVIVFTSTLGARKLTEWQGRVLKLLSGLMMVTLGAVLAFKPELLNNFFAMVGLLGGAIVLSLLISVLVHHE